MFAEGLRDMKNILKKIVNKLCLYYQKLKCEIYFFFQEGYGLSYAITNLPKIYLIAILKSYGVKVGDGTGIESGLIIHRIHNKKDFEKLIIGEKVHIGHNMLFDLTSNIEIGSNTAFGANCQIWTHTGNWTHERNDEKDEVNPVYIGKSVICYSGVIISQGVTIENYARVAAGSVVINNVKEKTFVGGVPAKFIKDIHWNIH